MQTRFKLEKPEKFSGERGKLRGFLTQMRAYILYCSNELPNESDKVLCAASLLSGQALAWFEPMMRDFLTYTGGKQEDETKRLFGDYEEFEEALKGAFGDPNEERANERRLENLRQKGAASQYVAEFRQISSHLDWDDEPLMAAFYRGLREDVKDRLIEHDRPDTLTKYMEIAVRIDDRLYERRRERNRQTAPRQNQGWKPNTGKKRNNGTTSWGTHSGPMEVDLNHSGTTNKDKKNVKCFRCNKMGHYARECKKPKEWKPVPDKANISMTSAPTAQIGMTCYDGEYDIDPLAELAEEELAILQEEEEELRQYQEHMAEWEHERRHWSECHVQHCSPHHDQWTKEQELKETPEHLAKHWSDCEIPYCGPHVAQATLEEEGYDQEEIHKMISGEDKEEGPWEILDGIWAWKYHEKGDILIIPTAITDNPDKYPNFPQQRWLERTLEEVEVLRKAYPHATRERRTLFQEVYEFIYETNNDLPTTNVLIDLDYELGCEEERYGTQPPEWEPVPDFDENKENQEPLIVIGMAKVFRDDITEDWEEVTEAEWRTDAYQRDLTHAKTNWETAHQCRQDLWEEIRDLQRQIQEVLEIQEQVKRRLKITDDASKCCRETTAAQRQDLRKDAEEIRRNLDKLKERNHRKYDEVVTSTQPKN